MALLLLVPGLPSPSSAVPTVFIEGTAANPANLTGLYPVFIGVGEGGSDVPNGIQIKLCPGCTGFPMVKTDVINGVYRVSLTNLQIIEINPNVNPNNPGSVSIVFGSGPNAFPAINQQATGVAAMALNGFATSRTDSRVNSAFQSGFETSPDRPNDPVILPNLQVPSFLNVSLSSSSFSKSSRAGFVGGCAGVPCSPVLEGNLGLTFLHVNDSVILPGSADLLFSPGGDGPLDEVLDDLASQVAVPEPASLMLLAAGLAGLALVRKWRAWRGAQGEVA
jgi:hypothetical protein